MDVRAVPLALLLTVLLTAPALAQERPAGFFTVNGGAINASPARETHLANAAAMGVTAVRSDALWNTIEPSPGDLRWTRYDSSAPWPATG